MTITTIFEIILSGTRSSLIAAIIAIMVVFIYGIIGIPSGVSGKALMEARTFSLKTITMSMEELEKMLVETRQKFSLHELYSTMKGTTEAVSTRTDIVRRGQYEEERLQTVKETGVGRAYGNGKTMVVLHSYEVSAKSVLVNQRFIDPYVHVVSYDHEQAQEIATDIKASLLRALVKAYLKTDFTQERLDIASDIAQTTSKSAQTVMQELNKAIDEELQILESVLVGKVMDYAKRPS